MAVTELAWLTAASGSLTPEGKEAVNQALNIQDGWFAQNAPALPKERENRGVGLFQQVEDPSIYLLTAHWESVDQHKVWLESDENKTVFPGLKDHFQLEKTSFFHYDVEIFTPKANSDIPLLKSPLFSLTRVAIAAGDRGTFDQGWNEVKGIAEKFVKPYTVQHGWRIEKEDEALEEFVLTCGWPSVERHGEFPTAEGFEKLSDTITPYIKTRNVVHYKRIL
ncbi:uncharacterized protein GGS22DRAFT_168122 [Annulohypoxylon maeteangense]|uniref:uncharacterized protein n=1 Tax=Annulohypoxylon maeteangense TaxID=1927788 RepID=UPI002008011A|nr:uncharacterized protein GGS22DRAFT_168122 [Annulohypoxylon maeteangense]KAI0883207.1 hypothetical protein GGS22DRAFT_168122 [Annulohypoxylon maeteangense]